MKGVFRSDASTVDWCCPSSWILPPVALSACTVSRRACSFFTATILPLFLLSCLTIAKENLICLLLGICSSKLSLHWSLLSAEQAYAIVSRQSPGSLTSRLKLLAQDTLLLLNVLTVYTPLSPLSHPFYSSHYVTAFLHQMTLPPSLSRLYLFFQNHPRCHLCLASCLPPRQPEHGNVSHPCLLPCLTFNLDCLFIHSHLSYMLFQSMTVWEVILFRTQHGAGMGWKMMGEKCGGHGNGCCLGFCEAASFWSQPFLLPILKPLGLFWVPP